MTEAKIIGWWEKPLADQKDWPNKQVHGWAPGMYTCTCHDCGAAYMGAKRSFQCYPCASTNDERIAIINEGAGI